MTDSSVRGQCHCGNIAFTLRWSGEPESLVAARSCGCTFCTPRAACWTSIPTAQLEVAVESPSLVSHYSFGTHTAIFHVCARCGGAPVTTSEIEGREYAVINVKTLLDVEPASIEIQPVDFDGEELASRLARRKRNWIADVRFVRAGHPAEALPGRVFRTSRTVLFGDCDSGGIVYTPRVAHFVAEAAMAFVSERIGTSVGRHAMRTGVWPPARVLNIEFLSPMTYDDRLDIEVEVEHVGESSFSLQVRARKQDRSLTFQARLVQVCVSAETMRPMSLPDDLRAKLES